MGDFKSPGLIGRTFLNDGLQIRRNAWRWTYCSERLTVDLLFGTPGGGQGETCKCQGAIQHQKLIAELIAHILRGKGIDGEADERTGDADPWRPAVVYLPLGEQTESKQTQQRTVSIRAEDVDGIYHARRINRLESDDEEHEDESHQQMHTLAELHILFPAQYIHTETCRNGCQS